MRIAVSAPRWVTITVPPGASAVPSVKWDNLIVTYPPSAPLKLTNECSAGAPETMEATKSWSLISKGAGDGRPPVLIRARSPARPARPALSHLRPPHLGAQDAASALHPGLAAPADPDPTKGSGSAEPSCPGVRLALPTRVIPPAPGRPPPGAAGAKVPRRRPAPEASPSASPGGAAGQGRADRARGEPPASPASRARAAAPRPAPRARRRRGPRGPRGGEAGSAGREATGAKPRAKR